MFPLFFFFLFPPVFYGLLVDLYSFLFPAFLPLLQTVLGALTALPLLLFLYRKQWAESLFLQQKHSFTGKDIFLCLGLGLLCCLMGNLLIQLSGILKFTDGHRKVIRILYDSPLLLQLFGTGLLVPAAEELIFRGIGYSALRKELGIKAAALLSAFLFGLYHGNPGQGLYAFLNGLLLAAAMEHYRTLAAPILIHISANLAAVLITAVFHLA